MASVYKQPCDEGVIRARPADAPCAERQRKWVLAATILGSSLAFIDGLEHQRRPAGAASEPWRRP